MKKTILVDISFWCASKWFIQTGDGVRHSTLEPDRASTLTGVFRGFL